MTETARGVMYPHRRAAVWVVTLAAFMDLLDALIVQVALPSMSRGLGLSEAQQEWSVSAYTLAFAVLLLAGGRLGDAHGRRRVLVIGVAGFTVASLAAAVATSGTALVVFRGLQGGCAALMVPQALASIQAMYGPRERAGALGLFAAATSVAALLGPVVGGALVSLDLFGWGWRTIFLINVPIGVALIVLAVVVPDTRARTRPQADVVGLVLAATGMFALTFGLVEGRAEHWSTVIWAALAIGVVLIAGFVLLEKRKEVDRADPLVPMRLFGNTGFSLGLVALLAFGGAETGFGVTFSIYVQAALGYDPLHAGLATVAASVSALVGIVIGATTADRLGRYIVIVGAAAQAAAMWWLTGVVGDQGTGLTAWDYVPPQVVMGLGLGMFIVPASDIILARVPLDDAGVASGLTSTFQQLGAAVGIAVVGTVFFGTLDGDHSPTGLVHAFEHGGMVSVIGFALAAVTGLALPGAAAVRAHKQRSEELVEAAEAGDPVARELA